MKNPSRPPPPAEHANLVLVFLDPIGKALVGRTMSLVKRLSTNHTAKMLYCLTKFDTAGDQVDRTNVVSQIVQELQGKVKVTHAIKLHTVGVCAGGWLGHVAAFRDGSIQLVKLGKPVCVASKARGGTFAVHEGQGTHTFCFARSSYQRGRQGMQSRPVALTRSRSCAI